MNTNKPSSASTSPSADVAILENQHATIAALNDVFRVSLTGGTVMMTAGILSLGGEAQQTILQKVRAFDAFSADNDPYGEHDFGSFEHQGEKIAFKIDYYDRTLTFGSDDPCDPTRTHRVLTIMLMSEW